MRPDREAGGHCFARLVSAHYSAFSYGISRECAYGLTEHSEGRALDSMLDSDNARERDIADSVISWLLAPGSSGRPAAMARRFGIMYMIWDRNIWGTYQMDAGWRPHNGSHPHRDHIHLSFSWDGAMQRTSWWTGRPWTGVTTTPDRPSVPVTPPDSYPTLSQGASGPDVVLAQKVIGVAGDGIFGPGTKAALPTWQGKNSVPRSGVLDEGTWAKMVRLGKVPARGGGSSGPGAHMNTSIRSGSTGEAVKALQRTLKVTADGVFGTGTQKAVNAFQGKSQLRVDGVVTQNVWNALRGKSYIKNGAGTRSITTMRSAPGPERAAGAEAAEPTSPSHSPTSVPTQASRSSSTVTVVKTETESLR